MNLAQEIAQDAQAAAILLDWLGKGGHPVPVEHAEQRAQVCAECSENVQPGWWDRVKGSIAAAIRQHLEVKNRLKITVPSEAKLHMCKACGCATPLKVHVPLQHLMVRISPATAHNHYPEHCWIRKEVENEFQQS